MRKEWLNNRQPDADGYYTLIIKNSQGKVISTYRRKSESEILDDLADTAVNANRKLGQILGKPDRANPPAPASFSDREKVDMGSAVTADPNKLVDTVQTIAQRQQEAQRERDEYYRGEAEAFRAAHPDYYPSERNQIALFKRLQENGWDLTRNNLALVFEQLRGGDDIEGVLEDAPAPPRSPSRGAEAPSEEDEEEEELVGAGTGTGRRVEPPATPQPRRSGLRSSDASALRPVPTAATKKPVITWEQLERMPREEYREKLRDPVFRRAVDELGEKRAATR